MNQTILHTNILQRLPSSQGVPDETADGKQAFLVIGNSLSGGLSGGSASTLPSSGTAYEFDRNSDTILEFGAGAGIVNFSNNSKSPWAKFCIDYNANTGKKPVIINRGAGSSTLSPATGNNDWQPANSNWTGALTAASTCLSQLGLTKLKGILIADILINDVQGINGTNVYSVAQMTTYLNTLITNLRTQFGTDVPIVFGTPGRQPAITTSARLSGLRNAIRQACITYDNVYIGATLSAFQVGGFYSDGVHLTATGNDHYGSMFGRWMKNSAYSKWARSIISCHFHELTDAKKLKIENWLSTWQSVYLQLEYLYVAKGFATTEHGAAFDWSFMSAPIIDGGFTVVSESHIATNGSSTYFNDGHDQLNSSIYTTQNDLLQEFKLVGVPGASAANPFAFGGSNTSFTYLRNITATSLVYAASTATADSYTTETAFGAGSYAVSMNSGTIRLYKNGVEVDSAAIASGALNGLTSHLGANNANGTPNGFLNAQFERFLKIRQSAIADKAAFVTDLNTLQS